MKQIVGLVLILCCTQIVAKEVLMTDNNEKKNARESRYGALHEKMDSKKK